MLYQSALQPYQHQVEALDTMRGRKAFALLMGMRTGKTKVIIDEWGEKIELGETDALLVIAPAGVYRTWAKEFQKHMREELFRTVRIAIWQSGQKNRTEFYETIYSTGRKVLLVNVEALSTVEEAYDVCLNFLQNSRAMLVIDESTTIKNPSANRTKAVCALAALAKWRRILSGLPTPTSPLDIFSQFWFLDPTILGDRNFHSFRAKYAVTKNMRVGGRSIKIVVGFRNVEKLNAQITPHSFRRVLSDCYDVPDKEYIRRDVDLTPEQARMYDDLKKRATTRLESGEHVTATEVIVQMLRLHQLCCGHLVDENGVLHEVPSNRLDELMTLLGEFDGKAVIWCSYRHDVEKIYTRLVEELGPEAVACFWGGNKNTRETDSARFETDPACTRMIATPGAGGRGRTWSAADLLVYYSNTDNLEHRDQSEERASGVGKLKPVTVVDLITRGTVEEKIVQSLRKKIDMAAKITGDTWKEWLI